MEQKKNELLCDGNGDCFNCPYPDCIWDEAEQKRLKTLQRRRDYRKAHRKELNERNRKYYAAHPEKLREKCARENAKIAASPELQEKRRQYLREWRAKNPDKVEEYKKRDREKRLAKKAGKSDGKDPDCIPKDPA